MSNGKKEILLVPQKPLLGGRLFGTKGIRAKETNRPWMELREVMRKKGFELKTIDESSDISKAHAVAFIETPLPNNPFYKHCLTHNMQDRLYLITFEPSVIHPPNHDARSHKNFKRVMTWDENLIDANREKYVKANFTLPILEGEKVIVPRSKFSEKKLLCLISSNKYSHRKNELYSERVRAIRFMEKEHPKDFDLYGVGWDQPVLAWPIASILPLNAAIQKFYPSLKFLPRMRSYPSYRGTVGDKKGTLPNYKFTIAYENELDARGYITEKILEAMLGGCVPVYLGDPNIARMVPKECFVDKKEYPTYPELYDYLASVGEAEHTAYINSMEAFLNGEKVRPFTITAFIESFMLMLEIN
ncbi:hypothetical protein JW721_05040 [Candidatus Micrarchaeota archaeon]|nr:hypothetical protein [Candidatus Micrarchaeota archaeon]